MTKRTDTDTEVLEVAVELHAKDEVALEAARARQAVREAAVELGVEDQLERAEEELARRRAEAEAKRERRGRLTRIVLGAVLAVGLGIAFWKVTEPTPPTPWTLVSARAAWTLDVSPGTRATSVFETHEGHPALRVDVAAALPRADGTWFVNLDRRDVPRFEGHTTLVIDLQGTLPRARVYLEAGESLRWRSPPIDVPAIWTPIRLPLDAFERQERDGSGRWHVVSGDAPAQVTTLSVKLGHFVNQPGDVGQVRVGEIHVE